MPFLYKATCLFKYFSCRLQKKKKKHTQKPHNITQIILSNLSKKLQVHSLIFMLVAKKPQVHSNHCHASCQTKLGRLCTLLVTHWLPLWTWDVSYILPAASCSHCGVSSPRSMSLRTDWYWLVSVLAEFENSDFLISLNQNYKLLINGCI